MLVCKIKSRIPKCLYIFYTPVLFSTKGVSTSHEPDFLIGTTLDLSRQKSSLESQARKKAKNNYNNQNLSEGSRSTGSTFARRINEYLQTLRTLRNPRGIIDTHVERNHQIDKTERRLFWSRGFKG